MKFQKHFTKEATKMQLNNVAEISILDMFRNRGKEWCGYRNFSTISEKEQWRRYVKQR